MLYIVSGASRAGKTIIAKKISTRKSISHFSLDWLVMGFTNGIPEYGIHDLLFPDEIAKRSWSFLKAMFESMIWSDIDYIIEGEAILPELIIELVEKYPDKLKICFVGFTNVTIEEKLIDIKKYKGQENDWLIDKSDDYIIDHIKNMITHSLEIKTTSEEHRLKYFDTSKDFMSTIDIAIEYMLE